MKQKFLNGSNLGRIDSYQLRLLQRLTQSANIRLEETRANCTNLLAQPLGYERRVRRLGVPVFHSGRSYPDSSVCSISQQTSSPFNILRINRRCSSQYPVVKLFMYHLRGCVVWVITMGSFELLVKCSYAGRRMLLNTSTTFYHGPRRSTGVCLLLRVW
jgi:hypothetical protein